MLYGAGSSEGVAGGGTFSPEKLIEMSEGFSQYTSATGSADDGTGAGLATKALVELILSENGNFIQSTLLDETAKLIDASVRDSYWKLHESPVGKLAWSALETQNSFANSIKKIPIFGSSLAAPVVLPYEIARSVSSLLGKSEEDETSLKLAQSISSQVRNWQSESGSAAQQTPSVEQIRDWLVDPNSLLRKTLADEQMRNSVLPRMSKISSKLTARVLHRASSRLERTLSASSSSTTQGTGAKIINALTNASVSSARSFAKTLES